ncbi:MAG: complex I subunit 5 family protein, partial [Acidimicrobiales bacterium]
ALGTLAAGCLAFGVLPSVLVPDVMGPAAGALLHPVLYARGVLESGGRLGRATVSFDYFSPIDLGTLAATIIAAVPLARFAIRHAGEGSRAQSILERIQTGSVNDYAAYLVLGFIATSATLVL